MQKLQPSARREKKEKDPELKTRLWMERAQQSSGWVYWSPPGPEEKHGGLFSDCQRGDRLD